MFFGLYADPETLPEVHEMPGLLDREITALARPRRRRSDRGRHVCALRVSPLLDD